MAAMISMPHCSSVPAQVRQQAARPAASPATHPRQLPLAVCSSSSRGPAPQPITSPAVGRWSQPRSRLQTHVTCATPVPEAAEAMPSGRLERSDCISSSNQDNEEPREFALAMAAILNDTKCQDIVVLDVSSLVSWTSYMVFGSVFSKPQLMAALARVEKMAAEKYERQQQNTPGNSPWECLDFGDCLLHVMSVEQRDFYDLESFYGAAEEVELPFQQEQRPTEDNVPQWTLQQPAL